jgi:hypothetical protein
MGFVVHIVFARGLPGIGNVVLRAHQCLREAGIKPVGFVCSDSEEPRMTLAPQTSKKALALLLESGFEFNEVSRNWD